MTTKNHKIPSHLVFHRVYSWILFIFFSKIYSRLVILLLVPWSLDKFSRHFRDYFNQKSMGIIKKHCLSETNVFDVVSVCSPGWLVGFQRKSTKWISNLKISHSIFQWNFYRTLFGIREAVCNLKFIHSWQIFTFEIFSNDVALPVFCS